MADAQKKNKEEHEEDLITDEVVSEFLKQRQGRISTRRDRIGLKLAKKNEGKREASIASSWDFLATDDGQKGGGAGGKGGDGKGGGAAGGAAGAAGGAAGGAGGESGRMDNMSLKRGTADPLDIQIDESRKQLEQIILDGESLITNVRIAAEYREKGRHTKYNESRKERCERLQREADESQQMFEDLKPNFDITADHKLPMDLYEAIKEQMQNCEELLMKKQELIDDLQREVEDGDFEFEQSLEMYQKDVSLMGDRIDDNMDELLGAFLSELNLIEDYTCRNREVILEDNQREWMDLLAEFEDMEAKALAERKSDALNKFKSLNELYITTKQECRAQRHKFEDDLRILIQELEQVKYATQLNMEKLQYNLAIVRKRFKENVEMKNMMKRLLLKFNDRFTQKSRALKKKMEAGKKEAKKILNDIANLEESLNMFGKKTLHLAVTDWSKYMDLWSVSEELVKERLQRLLDSEKFIFETQLGIEAPMPELDFMNERPEVVTKYMLKKNKDYADLVKSKHQETATEQKVQKIKSQAPVVANDLPDYSEDPNRHDPCASASLMFMPTDAVEFIPGPDPDPAIQRRVMKHIAKKICDERGFLIEEELRRLLEPYIETERNLVNLDAVLKALGVTSVTDMQYLAQFMLQKCFVMKGIISRIGSEDSAHLSEMNVSMEGILKRNAWEDMGSGTDPSTKSKSLSPQASSDRLSIGMGSVDTLFEECECDRKSHGPPPQQKLMGETSVDILQAEEALSRRPSSTLDNLDGVCNLLPELKVPVEGNALDFDDFGHDPIHCSPTCCGSHEDVEEGEEVEEEIEVEAEEEDVIEKVSKCSTCGGEPHDHRDCSFVSDMATVLSWVDPEDPPLKAYRKKAGAGEDGQLEEEEDEEEDGYIEIPDKVIENSMADFEEEEMDGASALQKSGAPAKGQIVVDKGDHRSKAALEAPHQDHTGVSPDQIKPAVGEEDSGQCLIESEPLQLDVELEDYGPPKRMYSDIQEDLFQPEAPVAEPSLKKPTATPVTLDEETDETLSIPSMVSSSLASEEFMYIEPEDVIQALTEFCRDYNAKITVEEPTLDELIDRKLLKFKYPRKPYVLDYWQRPMKMLSAKSDELWDTMEYCFQHFNECLKKRNEQVDGFIDLYKKNYELSHLLKNHLSSASRRYLPTPSGDSVYRWSGQYC